MEKYNLRRFVEAQGRCCYGFYDAVNEIRAGRKRSHWIWYIFPQLKALGRSERALYYGIENLEEVQAYLEIPSLRANLLEISGALLELESCDALAVMGSPDDKKLQSSMTLFAEADPACAVFQQVLDKFFGGKKDENTLRLIGK